MLEYDFHKSVGYWLTLAQQAFFRELTVALHPYGITFRQAQVLGYLALDGPLSQTQLASRMGVEPPTLVGVLDRMQRDGWVERTPCPDDRRRNLIRPLAAAQHVWSHVVECGLATRERATRDFSKAEVAQLKSLLDRVTNNLRPDRAKSNSSDSVSPESKPTESKLIAAKQ